MDDTTIRRIIREKLRAKLLPGKPPRNMWGGLGHGHSCAACGQPIGEADVELEIEEFGAPFCLHAHCHDVWREERGA
jgi:hypothetical protein